MDIRNISIFHMTHVDNLSSILRKEGLICKNMVISSRMNYVNISNTSVQGKRYETHVQITPFGTLHDYVPFYFCTRNPMLYAIYKNNVDTYKGGQKNVIFLVTTVSQAVDTELDFVFTDGHAIMAYTQFFNKISDLDKLNWEVINTKYWTNYEDGRRQRQAEFLIHKYFPWEHILYIGVQENDMREKVLGILRSAGKEKPVFVKSDWYF